MKKTGNEYFKLLKEWADSMLEYQITEHKDKSFVGGILCPNCMGIHGRTADAMYPLVYLYSVTEDKKYYNAAKLLFKWTMKNMLRDKGQIINDANSTWYGITVFFNIQLGELLYNLKDYIEDEEYNEWMAHYTDSTEYIYENFYNNTNWNINYRVATATSMAIAWRVFGNKKYNEKARMFAKISMEHITDEGFLYGENKPTELPTPRGYHPVDLGYNVEESLPNLALYLKYIDNDKDTEKILIKAMKAHLEFMLPDGAWDNTWGTRSVKWSYWGSRTSDGCQPAYEYLANKDETFFEAAHRNFELYKRCTINGLLAGGLHHKEMNEPPCIHHTFCHMKGLMCMAETKHIRKEGIKLPRETFDGIKTYSSMYVSLATKGDFTATFSADDYVSNAPDTTPTGGALTALYHKKAGMILAGSPNEFKLAEPHNMQVPRFFEDVCQMPRIELDKDGERFRNTYDPIATINTAHDGKSVSYSAYGMLKTYRLKGTERFWVNYTLTDSVFTIDAKTEAVGARYIMPVVSVCEDELIIDKNTVTIKKKDSTIMIKCNMPINKDSKRAERIFSSCGGLATAHLFINMQKNENVKIEISVK